MKTQEVKFQLNASGVYKPSVLTQAISMQGNSVKVNVPLWGGDHGNGWPNGRDSFIVTLMEPLVIIQGIES